MRIVSIRKAFLLFCLVCFLLIPLESQDFPMNIISVENSQMTKKKLREMHLDILMEWNDKIFIHASIGDLQRLQEENILYDFETQDLHLSTSSTANLNGSVNGAYHSYAELERDLISLQESYPELAKLRDIGDSLEKRNIYALKISDNVQAEESSEADILFLGCHHAREWISLEIPLMLGKYLVEHYNRNPRIKELVDQAEIWIVPLVNPDGLEYSIHFYRYWRKNRRNNNDGSFGVDPNRNYGFKWGVDNEGSSNDPSSDIYRGVSPFSEPENQAVRALFRNNQFQVLASYHSYSQVILFPWGYTYEPSEKHELLYEMAETMSSLMETVSGRFYGFEQAGADFYLTNGDTTDWSFGTYRIPSFTVELPPVDQIHGGFFNVEEEIQVIFDENLPAMLYLIEWAVEQKRQGNIPREQNSLRKSFRNDRHNSHTHITQEKGK